MAKNDLFLYQQKRDFTKTLEPSGKTEIAPAEYPRFVVQKHAARRLHHDLRFEVDGVFKSWEVTKRPLARSYRRRITRSITGTSRAQSP